MMNGFFNSGFGSTGLGCQQLGCNTQRCCNDQCDGRCDECRQCCPSSIEPTRRATGSQVSGPLALTAGIGSIVVKVQNVGRRTISGVRVRLLNEDTCPTTDLVTPTLVSVPGQDLGVIPPGCSGQVVFNLAIVGIQDAEVAVCAGRGARIRASVTSFTGTGATGVTAFQIPAAEMLPDVLGFCRLLD